ELSCAVLVQLERRHPCCGGSGLALVLLLRGGGMRPDCQGEEAGQGQPQDHVAQHSRHGLQPPSETSDESPPHGWRPGHFSPDLTQRKPRWLLAVLMSPLPREPTM